MIPNKTVSGSTSVSRVPRVAMPKARVSTTSPRLSRRDTFAESPLMSSSLVCWNTALAFCVPRG